MVLIGLRGSLDMSEKEKVLKVIQQLPDNASIEDAMERLLVLVKIERGITQADRGKTITHQDVKNRMEKWLK